MDEHSPQRRTVLRAGAVAALLSVGGSSAIGAQETAGDNERAAKMLREFYDGYLEGISQAVATDVQMEASMIEDGRDEPWPLAVWDDVEDARSEGITLGASEGGSQPFWDEYQSFDRDFDGGDGGDDTDDDVGDGEISVALLETNDPVPAGETLAVTAELETDADSATTAEVELVVGHDPTVVDTASRTVDRTETVTLEFETATVANGQTFPVRVEGSDDSAETSIDVIGTDETV
ncbi:hypothetical protein [Natronorubrum texcoconense]|uniref:CARDB protein n=1 Tax=Natronorubrum texcoconense TaxID=1095776 RepID=A0A1G8UQL6_9EURY|nr:hypothetical protein [Natronorubrum texcoconense]SDJ55395.1 hypothetical protein SAMN04515672_0966 [Natronorubrum texcoconense]